MSRPHEHASSAESDLAGRLRRHVTQLAGVIGARNVQRYGALMRAEEYIRGQFERGGYAPVRHAFRADGREVANVEAVRPGADSSARIVVIGAHYDSVGPSPGANDNASGVAALLELARLHAAGPPARAAVRFVAFVNEEPPHFMTETMGSLVYARAAAARGDRIAAMVSLETIGYYSDARGSQHYPAPFSLFFPDRGNFLAIVSNFRSTPLLRTVSNAFRSASSLPVIASPAPERIAGVSWSDHWAFWKHGVRAVMLTDTAPFRYPYYHTTEDTPDKVDYVRLARVVTGCAAAIERLGSSK